MDFEVGHRVAGLVHMQLVGHLEVGLDRAVDLDMVVGLDMAVDLDMVDGVGHKVAVDMVVDLDMAVGDMVAGHKAAEDMAVGHMVAVDNKVVDLDIVVEDKADVTFFIIFNIILFN